MNLKRYYNQNRKKVNGILIIIISAFLLFRLSAYIYHETRKSANQKSNITQEINHTNSTKLTNTQSAVTGNEIANTQLNTATKIIDQFLSYCNQKDLQKAYHLLTEECKTQNYPSLEDFEQSYYNDVFGGETRRCTVENWVNNIYRVKITEDILATGKSNNGYAKQDYITVKKVEDGYKLNINHYIGYTEINQKTEQHNIEMEVIGKNTYMDYEEYTIKITNHTESLILLDRRVETKTLYLEDQNQVKYDSDTQELTNSMLNVRAGETREISLKFFSPYVSTKRIKAIVFSDLMLYQGQLSERVQFRIEI